MDVDAELLPQYRGESEVAYPFDPYGFSSVANDRVALRVCSPVHGEGGKRSVCFVAAHVAEAERCVAASMLRLQMWSDISTQSVPAVDQAVIVRLGKSRLLAGPVIAFAACIARTCLWYAAIKEAA